MCYDSEKALERMDSVVAPAGPLPLCHNALRDEALAGPEQPSQSLWSCMWHSLKQHIYSPKHRISHALRQRVLLRSSSAFSCAQTAHVRCLSE